MVGFVFMLHASEFLFLQPSHVGLVRDGVLTIRLADARTSREFEQVFGLRRLSDIHCASRLPQKL